MKTVENFLQSKQINYSLHEHPEVYTCEDADKYCKNIPGLTCKNLFLKDKKGKRYFLVIIPAKKQAELKKICETIGVSKVSFANEQTLQEKLDLKPGSVSPFGLINDKNNEVEVYIDKEVLEADIVGFHPNRNTATLELSGEMFKKFFKAINKEIHII